MIKATAYQNHAVLKIVTGINPTLSSHTEFKMDLAKIKQDIPYQDRSYNESRKVWVVRNLEKYKHLKYIQQAITDRDRQPALF